MNIEKKLGKIKNESLEYDSKVKEQCIRKAIALSRRSIKRDTSFLEVLRAQLGVISKISWVSHVAIIICVSTALHYCIGLHKNQVINLFFVLLGPILQLVAIPEMLVSYRYKVWQIEQCTVISLAQIIIVRITIWQSINFIYLLGLSLVVYNFIDITNIMVYLFIPYNLCNSLSFFTLKYTKKNVGSALCIVINFMLMLIYYGGTIGKISNILNIFIGILVNHFFVLWLISLVIFAISIRTLYRNILHERGINYGFIN